MPQLWTETFVSQYFWLMLILLTFYFFISTKVIPTISDAIKARQITEVTEKSIDNFTFVNDKSINLFNITTKQTLNTIILTTNWDNVQLEWLSTNPENNPSYSIETILTEESKNQLEYEEEIELTLEEFIQSEDK